MSAADKAAASGGDVGGSSILLSQPIVLDNGTSSVKAGFAGGSKPKVRCDAGIAIAHLALFARCSVCSYILGFSSIL
jgi:Actin